MSPALTHFHYTTPTLEMAGANKKVAAAKSSQDKKAKNSKKSTRSSKSSGFRWSVYVARVLKHVIDKSKGDDKKKGKFTISGKAVKIVNSFLNDVVDRIAVEASNVARHNKAKTMSSNAVQAAVRLVLPGDLAKHAMAEGTKAVSAVASH